MSLLLIGMTSTCGNGKRLLQPASTPIERLSLKNRGVRSQGRICHERGQPVAWAATPQVSGNRSQTCFEAESPRRPPEGVQVSVKGRETLRRRPHAKANPARGAPWQHDSSSETPAPLSQPCRIGKSTLILRLREALVNRMMNQLGSNCYAVVPGPESNGRHAREQKALVKAGGATFSWRFT
jgi:hypothetical protein